MKDMSRAQSCHGEGLAEQPLLVELTGHFRIIIQSMTAVGAVNLRISRKTIIGDKEQRFGSRIRGACACNEMQAIHGIFHWNWHHCVYCAAQATEPKSASESLEGSSTRSLWMSCDSRCTCGLRALEGNMRLLRRRARNYVPKGLKGSHLWSTHVMDNDHVHM